MNALFRMCKISKIPVGSELFSWDFFIWNKSQKESLRPPIDCILGFLYCYYAMFCTRIYWKSCCNVAAIHKTFFVFFVTAQVNANFVLQAINVFIRLIPVDQRMFFTFPCVTSNMKFKEKNCFTSNMKFKEKNYCTWRWYKLSSEAKEKKGSPSVQLAWQTSITSIWIPCELCSTNTPI